jgi:hypothetical protein
MLMKLSDAVALLWLAVTANIGNPAERNGLPQIGFLRGF